MLGHCRHICPRRSCARAADRRTGHHCEGNTNWEHDALQRSGFVSRASRTRHGAYFQMVNDQGGVNGRQISFTTLDDGFSPSKTVEQTRRLVENDNVAFIYGTMGTAPSSAIQKHLKVAKIPHRNSLYREFSSWRPVRGDYGAHHAVPPFSAGGYSGAETRTRSFSIVFGAPTGSRSGFSNLRNSGTKASPDCDPLRRVSGPQLPVVFSECQEFRAPLRRGSPAAILPARDCL
jgi:hypothetical protein